MNKQLYEKENNINKPFFPVVRLEDIIDTISEKSIQWILNNYNHIYVEWKNDVVGTRLSVPTILRRNGLWITYNNGDKLITEYYIGKNTEIKDKHWQDDTNWEDYTNKLIDGTVEYRHLSESLKQLFNKGNVTNFPDEEDLTSDGVVLSFKDREYQPENFSGLGRVILRKNIVKIGEEYKNILTQSMINKENTIYEIRYDFDLNGGEITIPDGCIIKFNGGKIQNGTLIYNILKIDGDYTCLDTKLKGNQIIYFSKRLSLNRVNVTDYGSSYDIKTNIGKVINKILEDETITEIFIPKGEYTSHESINITRPVKLLGEGSWYKEDNGIKANSPFIEFTSTNGIYITSSSVTIEKISVRAVEHGMIAKPIKVDGSIYDINIIDCGAMYCSVADFQMENTVQCSFRHCWTLGGKVGFKLIGYQNTSTVIEDCWCRALDLGYHFNSLTYCSIINCCCDVAGQGFEIVGNTYSTTLIGCGTELAKALFYIEGVDGLTIIEPFGAHLGRAFGDNTYPINNFGSIAEIHSSKNINIIGGSHIGKVNSYDITCHGECEPPLLVSNKDKFVINTKDETQGIVNVANYLIVGYDIGEAIIHAMNDGAEEIIIPNGEYNLRTSVNINKSLRIKGDANSKINIIGDIVAFNISASKTEIDSLTIIGGKNAINIAEYFDDISIHDCCIRNCSGNGINVALNKYCVFKNIEFSNLSNGISCKDIHHSIFSSLIFNNCSTAIEGITLKYSYLCNIVINNSKYGININYSNNVSINTCYVNSVYTGIVAYEVRNVTIDNICGHSLGKYNEEECSLGSLITGADSTDIVITNAENRNRLFGIDIHFLGENIPILIGCSTIETNFIKSNSTSGNERPSEKIEGQQFFDTTINKPIYWTGSKWVDATGADV